MNNEIREFSTEELRAEIRRRELAYKTGKCWYCDRDYRIHNCKFAGVESFAYPGWGFKDPTYVIAEDCMANEVDYWRAEAYNSALGKTLIANGDTELSAVSNLVNKIGGFV